MPSVDKNERASLSALHIFTKYVVVVSSELVVPLKIVTFKILCRRIVGIQTISTKTRRLLNSAFKINVSCILPSTVDSAPVSFTDL